jgi:hypothetical protein
MSAPNLYASNQYSKTENINDLGGHFRAKNENGAEVKMRRAKLPLSIRAVGRQSG